MWETRRVPHLKSDDVTNAVCLSVTCFFFTLKQSNHLKQGDSRVFQECFKSVSRAFQERFKSVSRVFQERFERVSRAFQERIKGVSRVFQGGSESLAQHNSKWEQPLKKL